MTAVQLRLFELTSDGDDYWLVTTNEDEAADFCAAAQAAGIRATEHRQPRRKAGSPAKRIEHVDRIPFAVTPLQHAIVEPFGPWALVTAWKDKGPGGIIALNHWPPHQVSFSCDGDPTRMAYSAESGLYATLLRTGETREARLAVSATPEDMASWRTIVTPQPIDILDTIAFAGDDLLILMDNSASVIRHITKGSVEFAPLARWESNRDFAQPHIAASGDGRVWLVLGGVIYAYSDGQVTATNLPLQYTSDFNSVPTTSGFAYIASQRERVRGKAFNFLVELEVDTGIEHIRKLGRLDDEVHLQRIDSNWSMITRSGEPDQQYDLAQFWNQSTDQWVALPFGALGTHTLATALPTSDGALWAAGNNTVIDLGAFSALMTTLSERADCQRPAPQRHSTAATQSTQHSAPAADTSSRPQTTPPSPPAQKSFAAGLKRLFGGNR
jgi:hypothetical protein